MDSNNYDRIMQGMPWAFALHRFLEDENGTPYDYIFLDVNEQFVEYIGHTRQEIIGKRVTEIIPRIYNDDFDWIKTFVKVAYGGEKLNFTSYSKPLARWYRVVAYSPEKGFFATVFEDITEELNTRKQYLQSQQIVDRQEAIIEIYKKEFSSQEELFEYVLRKAIKIFESQYGYIFLYNDENQELRLVAWSSGVMSDCLVKDKPIVYELENTGVWGEVIRQERSIVLNNYHDHNPLKKGYPGGHVPIDKFMSIPVYYDKKIVATVGLANKKEDYTDFDVNQLTLLMQSAWAIKEAKVQVDKNELERARFQAILNYMPVLFCEYDTDNKLIYVNKQYCKYFGRPREELIGRSFLDFIPEAEQEIRRNQHSELLPDSPVLTSVHKVIKEDSTRWMEWQNVAVFDDDDNALRYYAMGMDVTERKLLEIKEQQELSHLRASIESHGTVMFFIDPATKKILYSNKTAENFYGYTTHELLQMTMYDISILEEENPQDLHHTLPHRTKNGEIKMVEVFNSLIDYGKEKVLFSIVFDVSDKDNAIKEIKYLAYHDYLTGIFNRRYFEESFKILNKKSNQPIAIIVGDINGMKLINETYGSLVGDDLIREATKSIQEIIPKESLLARISGDEYAVLLTNANEEEVIGLTDILERRLEKKVHLDRDGISEIYLSVSFGYGIQIGDNCSLDNLSKQAEGMMHKRKNYNSRSTRSHMVQAMISTLFQKSEREQKHSFRVGEYCEGIAVCLNWSQDRINKVKVAGSLHDIGKISIDSSILNKPGSLDEAEWRIMKEHTIKGANILDEIHEYNDIADIVASHHERMDGTGYPNGLKGEEILLESRVIAVADAFDAMTEYRTYKKAMTTSEAIDELVRCSGTQFDPIIVDIFVNQVLLGKDRV